MALPEPSFRRRPSDSRTMARGLQKVQSQLKSAGNTSKTAEERAADRKKCEAAATGQICLLCRQTFSNVAKEPMLRAHWESKHPKETDITKAFPQLKDCGAAGAATAAAVPAKKEKAAAAAAAAAAGAAVGGTDKKKKAAAMAAAAIAASAGAAAPAKPKVKPAKAVKAVGEAVGEAVAVEAAVAAEAEPEPVSGLSKGRPGLLRK